MRGVALSICLMFAAAAAHGADDAQAIGESPGKVDWKTRYQKELNAPRTMELVETPLDQVVEFIAGTIRINAYVDPRIAADIASVDLKCENQSIQEALPKVLEKFGLTMTLRDEALVVLPKGAEGEASAPAALNDEQKKTLDAAIKDLGSEAFEAREKAAEAIVKFGPAALGAVEAAAKESKDIQVKLKARALLKQLKILNLAAEKTDPKAEAALEKLTTPLSLEFFDVLLPQAIEMVSDALKNHKQPPITVEIDERLQQVRVTMTARDMQTGNILRWLARHGGAMIGLNGEKFTLTPPK